MTFYHLLRLYLLSWIVCFWGLILGCAASHPQEFSSLQEILVEAKEAALTISEDNFKRDGLRILGEIQADAGDFPAAIQSAKLMEDDEAAGFLVQYVTNVQLRKGDIKRALSTAATIKSDRPKTIALGDIAEAQVKHGDILGALTTVDVIKKPADRDTALHDIVVIQTQAGHYLDAIKTASAINDSKAKAWSLQLIGVAQAERGKIQDAESTIAGIEDPDAHAHLLIATASARAHSGDVNAAREIASRIHSPFLKDRAIQVIARVQAKRGDHEGAVETASNIDDPARKATTYCQIANIQTALGDKPSAIQTLQMGVQIAGSIISSVKPNVLVDLAEVQATAGAIESAKHTLDMITGEYPEWAGIGLSEIVFAQAKAGDVQGALSTASGLKNLGSIGSAYLSIARARVVSGDEKGATLWAHTEKSRVLRTAILLGIASGKLEQTDPKIRSRPVKIDHCSRLVLSQRLP